MRNGGAPRGTAAQKRYKTLIYNTLRAIRVGSPEARRLVELRDRWLNLPEWVEWVDEPVPGYPKRPVPRDEYAAKCAQEPHADEPLQQPSQVARRRTRSA